MSHLSILNVQKDVIDPLIDFLEADGRNVRDVQSSSFRDQKIWYIQNDLKKGNITTKDELISRIKEAFDRAGVPIYSGNKEERELVRLLKYVN